MEEVNIMRCHLCDIRVKNMRLNTGRAVQEQICMSCIWYAELNPWHLSEL